MASIIQHKEVPCQLLPWARRPSRRENFDVWYYKQMGHLCSCFFYLHMNAQPQTANSSPAPRSSLLCVLSERVLSFLVPGCGLSASLNFKNQLVLSVGLSWNIWVVPFAEPLSLVRAALKFSLPWVAWRSCLAAALGFGRFFQDTGELSRTQVVLSYCHICQEQSA